MTIRVLSRGLMTIISERSNTSIDIRYHYAHALIKTGQIDVQYVPLNEHLAGSLTKALSGINFSANTQRLGVRN
jgi:hypothetical protein